MKRSKMRIYGVRGYSDYNTDLYMTVDREDVAYLHMDDLFQKTRIEHIRIPADDVIEAVWPRIVQIIEKGLQK